MLRLLRRRLSCPENSFRTEVLSSRFSGPDAKGFVCRAVPGSSFLGCAVIRAKSLTILLVASIHCRPNSLWESLEKAKEMARLLYAFKFVGLLFLASCSSSANTIQPPAKDGENSAASKGVSEYTLGAGDVVSVKVFREKDLEGDYRIGADGMLRFPLIGDVPAEGLSTAALGRTLKGHLSEGFLIDPQVTVRLKTQNSGQVHVLGQVTKTGTFPFRVGMTVIEAITAAGGFTRLASKNGVTVTRRNKGRKMSFKVRVGDIGSGEAENFELKPGDIVNVPEAIF